MLTIDDPEIERFIREEADRTGEAPAAVLRRLLGQMDALEHSRSADDGAVMPNDGWPTRNGIRLLPRRPDEPPVTAELVRRLLGEYP